MALAALIVSIVAAMGSLGAIAVAVWTHRQQGSRLRCEWKNAFPVYGGQMANRHISVEAINEGRSPVSVSGWGFAILDTRGRPTDEIVVDIQQRPWQPTLPHRLEGESSASWMMDADDLRGSLAQNGRMGAAVKAYITTGTGKRLYADRHVAL